MVFQKSHIYEDFNVTIIMECVEINIDVSMASIEIYSTTCACEKSSYTNRYFTFIMVLRFFSPKV